MLVPFQIYGDHCEDIKTINQPWDNVPELDCDLRVQPIETFTRFFLLFFMLFDAIAWLILRMMSRGMLDLPTELRQQLPNIANWKIPLWLGSNHKTATKQHLHIFFKCHICHSKRCKTDSYDNCLCKIEVKENEWQNRTNTLRINLVLI